MTQVVVGFNGQETKSTPDNRVKLTFKKHVLPPILGVFMMASVFGLMNSQYIAAAIADATYTPAPTSLQPQSTPISDKPRIVIKKIGVKAPVVYGQKSVNESAFQLALRDGVVHYPQTAKPGEDGNVVIFGHSSGQVWAPGDYKFIFTHLSKLEVSDKIFIEYKGTRYIYNVSGKKIVQPTEVSVLSQSNHNKLTLITCTPVGTSEKRLIITADQIVPKPENTNADSNNNKVQKPGIKVLPDSTSPSLWHTITGLI